MALHRNEFLAFTSPRRQRFAKRKDPKSILRVQKLLCSIADLQMELEKLAKKTNTVFDPQTMKKGSWRGQRNGNVMYELGLAHAIRPATDIVVVRNDRKEINFDVAGIQVHHYPREDTAASRVLFTRLLRSALDERDKIMSIT